MIDDVLKYPDPQHEIFSLLSISLYCCPLYNDNEATTAKVKIDIREARIKQLID